eukprot:6842715-Lingulodinium_polyedra.AAC.1
MHGQRAPATLLANPVSPTARAQQWNTYCVAVVLYPAHIDLPPALAQKATHEDYAKAARVAGRAPGFVVGAIT